MEGKKISTRREFLKSSATAAGVIMMTSLWPGCDSSEPDENPPAAGENRYGYTIFSRGYIGGVGIKNRLIRSATMVAAATNGTVNDAYTEVYRQLAGGGIGLIITGFMTPTEAAADNPTQISIFDDRCVPGLAQVAEAVHAADRDCRLFAQIGHSGAEVGPSGIRWPRLFHTRGRVLTIEEIQSIERDFAEGIRRVREAGFDGVELHGAHAYLLSSFLSPYTNRRTDEYGGSLEKRVRIVKEIVAKARNRVGEDFPIIIKVNCDDDVSGGIEPEDFPELAEALVQVGVDAIDVSGNDCTRRNIDAIEEETYFLDSAVGADVNVPVIVTGGNRTIEHMETIINTGDVDFFGLARPLIREPNLPIRWLQGDGGDGALCISCNGCLRLMARGMQAYCIQES